MRSAQAKQSALIRAGRVVVAPIPAKTAQNHHPLVVARQTPEAEKAQLEAILDKLIWRRLLAGAGVDKV